MGVVTVLLGLVTVMLRVLGIALVASLVLGAGADPARATTLLFNQSAPGTVIFAAAPVPQAYGDNVGALSQGGFTYGETGEGFTPNVTVAYDTFAASSDPSNIRMWTTGYGDLVNVIYDAIGSRGRLQVTLTADPGFQVQLFGFDMGAWNMNRTIPSVQVLDGTTVLDNVLFSQSDVLVQGALAHTTFGFATPLTSQILQIRFNANQLGSAGDTIGIDSIRFAQQSATLVPEPGTLLLLASGLAGVGARAWRNRRKLTRVDAGGEFLTGGADGMHQPEARG